MRKLLLSLALSAVALFAQAQAINQVSGPPPFSWVSLLFYNGSNQLTSACYAPASTTLTTWSTADSSLTNIAVSSNTGTITFGSTAQVWVGMQVTVAGSATTALNATYKVLTVSGSTATITTSGVSNGTYNDATLNITTRAPVLNAAVWSIQELTYVSSNLSNVYWAGTPNGQTVPQVACSNRANY